jgi:hypothetical protein
MEACFPDPRRHPLTASDESEKTWRFLHPSGAFVARTAGTLLASRSDRRVDAMKNVLLLLVAGLVAGVGPRKADAAPSCGSWGFVPSPSPSSEFSRLLAVAAVTPSDVWAVGEYDAAAGGFDVALQTAAVHWDGAAWTVVPTPDPGPSGNSLQGVAAVSATDVWAVGYSSTFGTPQALVEHWDGSRWRTAPAPVVTGGAQLAAVAAVGADDVWAVGLQAVGAPGPATGTLVMHWDGAAWDVVPSPNVGDRSNVLNAVAVAAPDDVWAVGTARDTGGLYRTLIAHWDGATWRIVPSPNAAGENQLQAVAAVSRADVWATGASNDGTGSPHPLFVHWTGAGWSRVPSPGGVLPCIGCRSGLAAVATDDVWAVGSTIAHWDGEAWRLVDDARTPTGRARLYAVAPASACDLWAVGDFDGSTGTLTVTERLLPDGVAPAPVLASLAVTPDTVTGGDAARGTVALTAPAPAGGAASALSAASAVVTVPAGITIPAGATAAAFSIATRTVSATATVSLSAVYGGTTATAVLTVAPAIALSSVTLRPTSVTGGRTAQGTVALTAPAPATGASIRLTSTNPAIATVPADVTVAGGSTSATFGVRTSAVPASTPVGVSAAYAGATRTATLTVLPPSTVAIEQLEYDPSVRQLLVVATSTGTGDTLSAYVTATRTLIGRLTDGGGGRFTGTFSWPADPETVTVVSSLGGFDSETVAVAGSDSFTCTEILGFSQTLMWHETPEFQGTIDDARWQMRFRSGGDLDVWANPAADVWTAPVRDACLGSGSPVLCTPCAESSAAPDRVILTITSHAYESDVEVWIQDLRAAIATIRLRHPEARRIVLQPVVGGPLHAVCPFPDQALGVRASFNHPYIDRAIAAVVGDSPDLVAGFSPEVRSCADYSDGVGHLVPAARGPIGLTIGEYYR